MCKKLRYRHALNALLVSILLLYASTLGSGESLAQEMRATPEGGPGYAAGSSGNLPIGTNQSRAEIIAHSLTMPTVIMAVEECIRRGYVRLPGEDHASFFYNPGGTVVFLAFEKPGLSPPQGTAGAPLVVVGSMMNSANDIQTRITGGLIFVNLETAEVTTGSDYPQHSNSDRDFDGEDLTGGGGGRHLVTPNGFLPNHKVKRIKRYAACAGFGNATCLVSLLPIPTPWGGIRAGICVLLTTGGCFYTHLMSD